MKFTYKKSADISSSGEVMIQENDIVNFKMQIQIIE